MTATDVLRVLRERWRVVVAAILIAVAAAVAVNLLTPPRYTTSITMYVSAQATDSASSAFQAAQLSEQRVSSYVELVTSRRIGREVADQLGWDLSPDEVAARISASTTLNSVLIDVSVADESPERAAELANTVGAVFIDVVDELERPTTPGAPPLIAVRVVEPAAVPASASSVGVPTAAVVGLLAGLVVGVAGAFARNALDTTIRSTEQLRSVSTAPNLGVLALDPQVPKRPLTVHEDPQSPRAEAFRQLRNNLQFVDLDNPRKVVVVTSAMPAEGKTTTLVNLAIALSSANSRVIVVEGDLRRPKLSDILTLDRSSGLTTVLAGRASVDQTIQHWWGGGGFDLLASGPIPPNPSELLASRQMKALLDELRSRYDVVLVDTPPLLPVADAAAVAPATDGALVVCRYGSTTRTQLGRAVESLHAVNSQVLGTVMTMAPRRGPHAYGRYNALYRSEARSPAPGEGVGQREPSVGGRATRTWVSEETPMAALHPPAADVPTGRLRRVDRDRSR